MRLTLLQINDAHAYLELHQELFWVGGRETYRLAGGYGRIATLVEQARREAGGQLLLLDNGDTIHGTYPAVATRGEALIPVLRRLGVDAMTAHWDFAYGPKQLEERVAQLGYPLLAANAYRLDTEERAFPPYLVREVGGVRVGILGLASNTLGKTMPPHFSEGLRFTLGRDDLYPLVEELRGGEKVDLVVLLSHLGFPQDVKMVTEVPGIDVVLSGHTHHRLEHPVRQGSSLIVQSGSHGSFLGQLELEVERGMVVDYRHRLIEVAEGIEPDRGMEDVISALMSPHRDLLSVVVGETRTALNRNRMLESTMDNFLLQALLEATGAQLAFSNGWRYGAPVTPGQVTMNDLYNIIPTNPPVSTVELRGEELIEMLEENLERTFAPDPFGQMGGYLKRALGLRAYFKVENPRGHRIQKLFAGGEEVRPNQSYQAAFVTAQGVPPRYVTNRQDTGERAVEVLRRYLSRRGPVTAELRDTFVAI